ncbi:ovochymase-2-like [Hermetia illucens]|uniref:ovochymase-2-like n=1 Tax=Hermetia illucens TaxID=343691 RepID=UPI0018CC4880|nr:ovochymase-2-like [Hermetia illucens]
MLLINMVHFLQAVLIFMGFTVKVQSYPEGFTIAKAGTEVTTVKSKSKFNYQTEEGEFPGIISFRYRGRMVHECTGALVSMRFALSAAHCFDIFSVLTMVAVSRDFQEKSLARVYTHPNFEFIRRRYDVAIIETVIPFVYSKDVEPVPIALHYPESGSKMLTVGWKCRVDGKVRVMKDQMATTVQLVKCVRQNFWEKICAEDPENRRDNCQNDDGSPLLTDYGHIVAIYSENAYTSVGHPKEPLYRGFYTNLKFCTIQRWMRHILPENIPILGSRGCWKKFKKVERMWLYLILLASVKLKQNGIII